MPRNKGKHLSKEHKRKISEANKGRTSWHKGKKRPKISKALMGNKNCLGKKHSEETKDKISKANKGHVSWNKGIPRTEAVKKKLSEALMGRSCWSRGKKLSVETRKKMSASQKGKHSKSYYQKIGTMSAVKQQNSKESTSIEKKVYEELKRRGLLFEKQKLINGRFLVDAWIPSLNLIIEADGNYWHNLDRVKKKDRAENAYLKTCGFNLLRLSETEINNGSFRRKLSNG